MRVGGWWVTANQVRLEYWSKIILMLKHSLSISQTLPSFSSKSAWPSSHRVKSTFCTYRALECLFKWELIYETRMVFLNMWSMSSDWYDMMIWWHDLSSLPHTWHSVTLRTPCGLTIHSTSSWTVEQNGPDRLGQNWTISDRKVIDRFVQPFQHSIWHQDVKALLEWFSRRSGRRGRSINDGHRR